MQIPSPRKRLLSSVSAAAILTIVSNAAVAQPSAPQSSAPQSSRYAAGDFHNHTTCTDGAVSTTTMIRQSVEQFGLEWLIDAGHGLFVLGNHDRKLGRALAGHGVRMDAALAATLEGLDDDLRARALQEITRAPAWVLRGQTVFVHGGFHPAMLHEAPPPALGRVDPLLSRALFGETTGRMQADGYPERVIRWVDRIPAGMTVYCGHDQRSTDGRPYRRTGLGGGEAVFLDTGAGKGGHLSWIDLDAAPAG